MRLIEKFGVRNSITYRKLLFLNLQKGDYIYYSQAAGEASIQGRLSFHQGIMSYCKESY